jgi:hypothetical protein
LSTDRSRTGGALLGFALLGLPGGLAAVGVDLLVNPAFVDQPLSAWFWLVAVPGSIGAIAGAVSRGRLRGALLAVPASLGVFLGLASLDDGTAPIEGLELLVVGIDGATWEVADPMIAAGELPALAQVRREGAHGVMKASGPLFSPLLWTTMASGKPHADHGVHGFHVHATDCRVPRFFDVAEHKGRSVGLYKWLVTWPPRELRHGGFIVPAWLAPSPETEPADLSFVKELELSRRMKRKQVASRRPSWRLAVDGVAHGLRWSTLRDAGIAVVWERLLRPDEDARFYRMNLLRGRIDRDVFLFAMRRHRPKIATFTYYTTDGFGHRYWKYHQPDAFTDVDPAGVATYGEAVRDAYREADAALADAMRLMPEGARLVVVSDHGFEALRAVEGVRVAPRTDTLHQRIADDVGPAQVARVGMRVSVVLEGDDVDGARAKLDALLASIVLPGSGEPLFRWEGRPDDARTVDVDLRNTRVDPGSLDRSATVGGRPLADWVTSVSDHSGDHTPRGLFAAMGPGVTKGAEVDVDLLDVAPILLAALDLPKGADMPGHVPSGLWPAAGLVDSWDHVRAELYYPDLEGGVNDEMLQILGYTDSER